MKNINFIELQQKYSETCSIDMANKIVSIIQYIRSKVHPGNVVGIKYWTGRYKDVAEYLKKEVNITICKAETYANLTNKRIALLESVGFKIIAQCVCKSKTKEIPDKIYLVAER